MDKDIQDIISHSLVRIKVKPNSAKTEIKGVKDGVLFFNVKAPPEDNKANIEIIKFFTRLTKKKVRIKRGLTSKQKILELS